MNQSAEKLYSLARAIWNGEELPTLYAPGLDLALPANLPLGKPIPAGVVVKQPVSPDHPKLARKPIERDPTKVEEQAFAAHWTAIEASAAAEVEATAEAARWWLPYPVPIPTASPLPPDILVLSDTAKELGYCRPRRFAAFLRRCKYPAEYGVISRRALTYLQAKKDASRLEYKNNWQKANRPKAVPEPKEGASNKKQPAAR